MTKPALVDTGEKTRLFISYSRADGKAVLRLVAALQSEQVEAFQDKKDILPSEEWRARLEALIGQSDTFVFCLSPDSAASEVCAWEIAVAQKLNKRIVPVVLRDVRADAIPTAVAKLNFVFVRAQDSFDEGLARLRLAIDLDVAWIREHTRLGELARRWQRGGKPSTEVLRGRDLDAAESWLAVQPRQAPAPTEEQREYVAASRRGATRRQRNWIVASLTVAAVSIGLSILAYWQRNEAVTQRTHANARRLAAEAQVLLSEVMASPHAAVQNLLASLRLEPSDEARHALKVGLSRLPPEPAGSLAWPAQASPKLLELRFSPDGSWLAAATARELLVWDTKTHALRIHHRLDTDKTGHRIEFSPDGRHAMMLIGAGERAAAGRWVVTVDLAGATAREHKFDLVYDVAASAQGLLALVAGPARAQVRVIELTSGRTIWETNARQQPMLGRLALGSVRSKTAPAAADMTSAFAPAPPPVADVVLVTAERRVSAWRFDERKPMSSYALPAGARLLSFGELGAVMAVRRADGLLAVVDATSGTQRWRAAAGTASDWIGFTGADRFVATRAGEDVRVQSIAGGFGVTVEPARRTDYDLGALANVERYSPIIDARTTDDGSLLVMAWKDGRVDVWRPGLKPRYGGIDGVPRPSFEAVAQFQHGDTLGPSATWSAPPPLFVSPTGRFVASQSMGLQTNALGGITAFNPVVRIWDTRRRDEVARFQPQSAMLVVFSPTDELVATVTASASAERGAAREKEPRLELWRLSSPQSQAQRERLAVGLELTRPAGAWESGPLSVAGYGPKDIVWVGADRKLRMLDTQIRRVVVVDDLAAAADAAFAEARQEGGKLTAVDALAEDPYRRAGLANSVAPEVPLSLYPVAVSGDRRRAVVKVAATLRLYALDEKRLIATAKIGDDIPLNLGFVPAQLVISHKGSAIATGVTTAADVARNLEQRPRSSGEQPGAREFTQHVLVFSFESNAPVASLEQRLLVIPPMLMGWAMSRPLAVTDDGRLVAMEERAILRETEKPPRFKTRVAVRDARTGEIRLETAEHDMPSPLDTNRATKAAAFSARGQRLLLDESEPACPPQLEMSPASVPMYIPSCPDLHTTLTLWDLAAGSRIGEASFEATPWNPPVDADNAMAAIMAQFAPRRPAALTLVDEETVVRTQVDFALHSGDRKGEVQLTSERISMIQSDPVIRSACSRLPEQMRDLSKEAWTHVAPGENYRPICGDSLQLAPAPEKRKKEALP